MGSDSQRSKKSKSERDREALVDDPRMHEAGVVELMELYDKIEQAYSRAYFEPPQPSTFYSASANA